MNPVDQTFASAANQELENWQEWRQTGQAVPFTMEQQPAWLGGVQAGAAVADVPKQVTSNSRQDYFEGLYVAAFVRDLMYMSRTAPYLMRNARCKSGLNFAVHSQVGSVAAGAQSAI